MTEIYSILTRYISGEANPDQALQAEEWINASPANQQEFEQLWQIMQHSGPGQPYSLPDTAADWQQVEQQLPSGFSAIAKTNWLKIAAYTFGAGIMAVAVLWMFNIKEPAKQDAVTTRLSGDSVITVEVKPGITVVLDQQSRVDYSADTAKNNTLTIRGAAFLTIPKPASRTVIQAGAVKIQPGESTIYVAYDSASGATHVQVQSGVVVVQQGNKTNLVIRAGESMLFDRKGLAEEKHKTNINRYGFATRMFEFTDTPLGEVAALLEKAYHVSIVLQTPGMKNCRVTTRFDDKTLDEVLDILSITLQFSYSYPEKNKVLLVGKTCD